MDIGQRLEGRMELPKETNSFINMQFEDPTSTISDISSLINNCLDKRPPLHSEMATPKTKPFAKKRDKYAKIPISMRRHLVDLVENDNLTILKASKYLGLKYSTAKTIVQIFRKEGRINVFKKIPKKHLHNQKVMKFEDPNEEYLFKEDIKYEISHPPSEGGNRRLSDSTKSDTGSNESDYEDQVKAEPILPKIIPFLNDFNQRELGHPIVELPNILKESSHKLEERLWKEFKLGADKPQMDFCKYKTQIPNAYINKIKRTVIKQLDLLVKFQNQFKYANNFSSTSLMQNNLDNEHLPMVIQENSPDSHFF